MNRDNKNLPFSQLSTRLITQKVQKQASKSIQNTVQHVNMKMSKCKHNSLSIATKVEVLEKLDQGESVKKLCLDYSVGKLTIYDLKQQRKKILNYY